MRVSAPAPNYDVVIIGGGMVGASFACALGQALSDANPSILVIEAVSPSDTKTLQPSFDARSTALSYGTSRIYARMGLWKNNLEAAVTPITEIQVSDKGRFGTARITAAEEKVTALGFVVENSALGASLNTALDMSEKVQMLCPAQISTITPQADGMSMEVSCESNRHQIAAKLVVLADGGRSPICKQLGISQQVNSYGQQALIANVAFEKPHENIAFERFTDTGPLAVLPLAKINDLNRCSLVWTLEENQVEEYRSLSDTELVGRLQNRFGNRLGRVMQFGERFCYPLNLVLAKEQIRPGLVLLGNVAHTLHPVAGQGLNLAMRDASTLVAVLEEAWREQQSPGNMQVLQKYLAQQERDQEKAIHFTDYATRLFSSNNTGKVLARKLGLLSVDLIPALRHEFARQAMGLVGRH